MPSIWANFDHVFEVFQGLFFALSSSNIQIFQTFVDTCQNEVLSEERQLMKWVGIFRVGIFHGGFPTGEFDGWKYSQGRIFLESFKIYPLSMIRQNPFRILR